MVGTFVSKRSVPAFLTFAPCLPGQLLKMLYGPSATRSLAARALSVHQFSALATPFTSSVLTFFLAYLIKENQ